MTSRKGGIRQTRKGFNRPWFERQRRELSPDDFAEILDEAWSELLEYVADRLVKPQS